MPHPPIDPNLRRQIAIDIRSGVGRNELARRYGVSTGLVTKIAQENNLWFERTDSTTATHARQIDMWAQRVEHLDNLTGQLLALPSMNYSGKPNRRYKKLERQIDRARRQYKGDYPA